MFSINRLVIIGGLSCSGKTTLLERIRDGRCPHLCEQLGVDDPTRWPQSTVKKLAQIRNGSVERLLLHYDFHVQYSRITGFRKLPVLLMNAHEVTVLTLCAPLRTLAGRQAARLRRSLISADLRPGRLRQFRAGLQKQRFLKRPQAVEALYEKWFQLFEYLPADRQWLIDTALPQPDHALPYDPKTCHALIGIDDR